MKKRITINLDDKKGFIFSGITSFIYFLLFCFLWETNIKKSISELPSIDIFQSILSLIYFTLLVIIGAIFHELIHAFFFLLYSNWKTDTISFSYKFKPVLILYTHTSAILNRNQYIISLIMPFVFLGFFPLIYSMVTGGYFVFLWGLIFSLSAFGDFLVIMELLKLNKSIKIGDLPDQIGFEIQ